MQNLIFSYNGGNIKISKQPNDTELIFKEKEKIIRNRKSQ